MPRKAPYIVVFDMDETLGHFSQLGIFWDVLQDFYINIDRPIDIYSDNGKQVFFDLLNIFNKFLRPDIENILILLKKKKKKKNATRL